MPDLLLLGQPALNQDGELLELPPELPTYLLSWLATQAGWVDRGAAASMFWPDEPESSARHNLSQLLYRSRKQPWFSLLDSEPRRLRYAGDTDVSRLQHALASGNWEYATALYRGPLLGNMTGPDVGSWTEWLESERENLLATWSEAASSRAAELGNIGQHAAAAALLQEILRQDPLAEGILQDYLQAAGRAGQRTAGAAVFREFSRLLKQELGMAPLPETRRLAEELHAAEPAESRKAGSHGLRGAPAQLSPFIARDLELAQLATAMQKADVRLVTITGPGGMGKTRLALQVGQALAQDFDTAALVPLASLESAADLPLAIASALDLSLNGSLEPEAALGSYLRDRSVLLVLDNFEHLLAAGPLLARLLELAPRLKALVTSREPLGLRGEVLFELDGLSLPTGPSDPQFEDYGAVQLFLRSAGRLYPDLELVAADRPHIYRIIRLLAGLPLGIELAVPWLRLLPASELAGELERNLDLLQAGAGTDLPDRHRSLGAAFEHSWQLLSEQERSATQKLAVFRGPFSRKAAERVAGAGLPVLLSLVNKSLMRRVAGGRFELQQPARQYALGKLQDQSAVRNQHAAYLAEVATIAEAAMHGSGQREWLDRLASERDDFLAAINWSLESDQATLGLTIASALQPLWWIRGPYRQGADLLLALIELPSADGSPLLARGLHRAGTLIQELSDNRRTVELYDRALGLARAAGDKVLQADIIHSQGYRLDKAGELEAAASEFERSIALYREAAFLPGESASLNSLAVIRSQLGQGTEAEKLFLESLKQKRELGQTQGVAYALHNLGVLYLQRGDEATARRYIGESTELKRQIGDTRGVISALLNEAVDLVDEGRFRDAASPILEILEDAWRLGLVAFVLRSASLVARSLLAAGQAAEAARLIGAISAQLEPYDLEPYYLGTISSVGKAASEGLGEQLSTAGFTDGSALSLEQLFDRTLAAAAALHEGRIGLPDGAPGHQQAQG